jgi:RHS repeat-associated protein
VQARYTTAAGSYYAPLLHMWRVTGESRFPMYDLTGSARGLVDATGAVTDTYSLELFGKQRSSTGTTPNPYRFGGAWGYINGVSGLQQLGARFYWPELGRFIQRDPIGEGMNWHAYVENNPVKHVDPSGRCLMPPIMFDRQAAENAERQRQWEQERIDWAISALDTLGYIREADQLRGKANVVAWLPFGATGWYNPLGGTVHIVSTMLESDDQLLSTLVHEAQHGLDMAKGRGVLYTHRHPNGREDAVINDYADAVRGGRLAPGNEERAAPLCDNVV